MASDAQPAFLEVQPGDSALILSMPHAGRELCDGIEARLAPSARELVDTDWWMERLYDFDSALDASLIRTRLSRYVIDVNRDPSGASLYPGQAVTELCPTTTFDGQPLYRNGEAPDRAEVQARTERYFRPYHDALARLVERNIERHGYALIYDCHSIRSRIPRLFDGELPVFNIGTADGRSCAPAIERELAEACAASSLSSVVNGRFTGGWITRRYGDPSAGVHALQMELAQRAYMRERPPWTFDSAGAERVRAVLRPALERIVAWAATHLPGARRAADPAHGDRGARTR